MSFFFVSDKKKKNEFQLNSCIGESVQNYFLSGRIFGMINMQIMQLN